MLRALLASLLMVSTVEAAPITFGAGLTASNTGNELSPLGTADARSTVVRYVPVPDGPLLLTVPGQSTGPCFSGPFSCLGLGASRGSVSLLLQEVDTDTVVGGYRFIRVVYENSPAQFILCHAPNACVSERQPQFTAPPLDDSPGTPPPPHFDWPEVPFNAGDVGTPRFGPDDYHFLIPPIRGGLLKATIDLSVSPGCVPFQVPFCESSVTANFALEPVPEPATVLLFTTTAAALGAVGWWRRHP